MNRRELISAGNPDETVVVRGSRYAIGPLESAHGSIHISGGRITAIQSDLSLGRSVPNHTEIDLSGFLLLPGLINAHDHLEFALYPRLADPPYCNYVEWGEDIHDKYPEVIAKHRAVPKDVRVWWGGIRNLLCGVTTVSHHNPLLPQMRRSDFPIRVVQEYGWAHSLALGGDLRMARAATPKGRAFIVHACEGVDGRAREELWALDKLGLFDEHTVLVHGLAIDGEGVALMIERQASLIVCPSSNYFLFRKLPDLGLLSRIPRVALGNDSPLTAAGDLLDEIRFAIHVCKVSPQDAYRMVTTVPAEILQLGNFEGSIRQSGVADLIAIRDTGGLAAERLPFLSMEDVELVMIAGRVHSASGAMLERLPRSATQDLEPLSVGTATRWLRAPVVDLLRKAEEVLGKGEVRLCGKTVCATASLELEHAC
jgi:cytosine/adenosine deaminase-related metal-dependent hydrolase